MNFVDPCGGAFVTQRGEGAGPGGIGADESGDVFCAVVPVDAAMLAQELPTMGGERGVLWDAWGCAVFKEIEGALNAGRCHAGEPIMQAATRVFGRDGGALGEQDIAGIEPLIHIHDGDA